MIHENFPMFKQTVTTENQKSSRLLYQGNRWVIFPVDYKDRYHKYALNVEGDCRPQQLIEQAQESLAAAMSLNSIVTS